ncbi:hypothetical protein DUNSADRAFT_1969 [Dunaliella salina]|uniref:RRM domain-containing protein n=1 Tax=Dunaliella salina TaxID=3046 RepID=A0ABQ7FWS3_DUNSA|nr:hypothetical protein DUNSADRAFT_1969 [Dunaliella salina]|eukprot:KAF5826814.1 hypothetical protein DUNSADRAFT_1969 [Dunaliella salina]
MIRAMAGAVQGATSGAGAKAISSTAAPPGETEGLTMNDAVVLRLKNLPTRGAITRDAVCQWFNNDESLGLSRPLTRDRVEMLVHATRRPRVGNHAFVHFFDAADAQKAMSKHEQLFERSKVQIEPTTRTSVRGLPGHNVFLRGLSFDVTAEEVAAWFNDLAGLSTPVTPDRVAMADVASMESTGLAWVGFPNPQEAAAASTKHTHMMGQRYIEILPAASTGVDSNSTMLALRGLPFNATMEDLCAWFNDDANLQITPITPDRISYTPQRSCPLGCAFVTFPTPEEATLAAVGKHKQHLGERYIEVHEERSVGTRLRTFLPAR